MIKKFEAPVNSEWVENGTGRRLKVTGKWSKDMGGSWAVVPDVPMVNIQFLDNGQVESWCEENIETACTPAPKESPNGND